MAHYSISHVAILLISIVMWIAAAAVIITAAHKMKLFGRRPK